MKTLEVIGQRAGLAARLMAVAGTARKNAALATIAETLTQRDRELRSAWRADHDGAQPAVSAERMAAVLADELLRLAEAREPIGAVLCGERREDGSLVEVVRAPIGAVGVIAGDDPMCVVRAAALLIKAGNAGVFYCEPTAQRTMLLLMDILRQGLLSAGLPADALQAAQDASVEEFLALPDLRKMLVNGESSLSATARALCRLPLIVVDAPVDHFYVAGDADPESAVTLTVNACTALPRGHALHTLLLHRGLAGAVLAPLREELNAARVTLCGDADVCELIPAAPVEDWRRPMPGCLCVRLVGSLNEALALINVFGSGHAAGILTNDCANAQRFAAAADAAVVTVNTAPAFSDGVGLDEPVSVGLCADGERGPVGLAALTTLKRVVSGNGQTR